VTAMIRSARQPKKYTATAPAGTSAMITSSMMLAIVCSARMCGDEDTRRSPLCSIRICLPYFVYLRVTACLATRMKCTIGSFEGQT